MNDEDFNNNIQSYLKEWEDFKDLALTHKKLDKLQSNWNSLREYFKDLGLDWALDKMNELESSDSN